MVLWRAGNFGGYCQDAPRENEENSWNNFVIRGNHSEHHWIGDDLTFPRCRQGEYRAGDGIDLFDIAWTWDYQHGNVNSFFQKIRR